MHEHEIKPKAFSPRSWAEDFGYRTLKFDNECRNCREIFIAHAARLLCKVCYEEMESA